MHTKKLNFACKKVFFFENKICLSIEFDLPLKKKTQNKTVKHTIATRTISKLLGKIFCCRRQKNASHALFIYGNCMISTFFDKYIYIYIITPLFYKQPRRTN